MPVYTLIPHSTKNNEWQMAKDGVGITPGTMQYKLTKEIIISLTKNLPISQSEIDNPHWTFDRHTEENLRKLTPNTPTGRANEWKLLLVMKTTDNEHGVNGMKGALINKTTNQIALMSCLNKVSSAVYKERVVRSMNPDYKICRSKMVAPLLILA